MRASLRVMRLAFLVLSALAALAGCGGGSPPSPERAAPSAAIFPAAEGRTLAEIASGMRPGNLVVSPTGLTFDRGPNRYAFGVFTLGKEQVTDADVALYFARGADGKAIGPFPARVESLETRPAYRAQTTSLDPEAALAVYVVPRVDLPADGEWRVFAVIRKGGSLTGTLVRSIEVGGFPAIPARGERAPRIHTPTAADVGGDLSKIDTRIPPDQMHKVDLADVYGKKPIALLFSTPQFCESRVCGPVADIAEEINDEFGDEVAFIHMEVYRDNDPGKGIRPQLRAFHLETEPWLFVIGRDGRVSTRIEGGFGGEEMRRAIEAALREEDGGGDDDAP
ncbi:MAG: hypothetical protein J0H06_02425 [Actinobacteria bacterium]|nr:hypothetical protein [Actinomycetota bacterium]